MRIKIGVVDPDVGLILVKTSSDQINKVSRPVFEEKLKRALETALNEVGKALEEKNTSYVEKTVYTGRKRLND